jgi:hypothetical protein
VDQDIKEYDEKVAAMEKDFAAKPADPKNKKWVKAKLTHMVANGARVQRTTRSTRPDLERREDATVRRAVEDERKCRMAGADGIATVNSC